MDWSGTTPIPDGDRVEPLPPELRADLGRRPHELGGGDPGSNWIVAVAIVLCVIPFAVWLLYQL